MEALLETPVATETRPLNAEQQKFCIKWRKLALRLAHNFRIKQNVNADHSVADELIGAAHLGLVHAARNWRPEMGEGGGRYVGLIVMRHLEKAYEKNRKFGMRKIPKNTVVNNHLESDLLPAHEIVKEFDVPEWPAEKWERLLSRIDTHADQLTAAVVEERFRFGRARKTIAEQFLIPVHHVDRILRWVTNNPVLQEEAERLL